MKKLFTLAAFCAFFAIAPQAFAQSTEGEPILLFTAWGGGVYGANTADAAAPAIRVTPNPSVNETVKVWYKQLNNAAELRIVDISGKVHHQTSLSGNNPQGMIELNVSSYAPGVYIVQLSSGLYKAVEKIVIR